MLALRKRILLAAVPLIALLPAPVLAAEPAKPNAVLQAPVHAASPQQSAAGKSKYASRYPRFAWFFHHWRCVHLGCEGVHAVGVGY